MPAASITEIGEALDDSVRYTLETMCFSEAAPAPARHSETSKRARVTFRSSLGGTLELAVAPACAHGLAAALLGSPLGDALAEDDVDGTVCELAVVICGRFLSSLDPLSSLQLGPPQIVAQKSATPDVRLNFKLHEGDLTASLYLD